METSLAESQTDSYICTFPQSGQMAIQNKKM